MPIKHSKVSTVSDVGIPEGWVKPSNWNEDHILTGLLALLDAVGVQPSTIPAIGSDGVGRTIVYTAFMAALLGSADAATMRNSAGAAPINSPEFTGTPLTPNQIAGNNSQRIANTAYVDAAIATLLDSAPAALDTINELAAALGDDPNFSATIMDMIALKAPINSPNLTGEPTAPTVAGTADSTSKLATTAFVQAVRALLAPLDSPALTGEPTAPTVAGTVDSTTKLATTAFVQAVRALLAPLDSPVFIGNPQAPTPAPGDNDTSIATTAFIQAALAAAGVSNPNRLINGEFQEFQRGGGNYADGAYCADGAILICDGGSVNVDRLTDPENGAPFGIRLTQLDAGAKRIGLVLPVESIDSRDLRGLFANISGRVRCSVSQPIRFAILGPDNAADGFNRDTILNWASASYTAGGFFPVGINVMGVGTITPAANTWTSFSLPAGSAFGSTMNNILMVLWTEGTLAQNATLDFNRCKVEAGQVATAFKFRQASEVRIACQRWYEKFVVGFQSVSGAMASRAFSTTYFYRTSKRALVSPTLSDIVNTRCTSPSVTSPSVDRFGVVTTNTLADGDDFTYSATVTVDASIGV